MSDRPKLLIVDDDEAIRTQMKWAFGEDYEVLLAEDREAALQIVAKERPPIITLDLGLPPNPHEPDEGFRVLSEVVDMLPACKVVVITGQGERENALRAVASGAHDFFFKPIRIEELGLVLRRALQMYRLEEENRQLEQQRSRVLDFEDIVGSSPAMQPVFEAIRKVATTDTPVLIAGETGTGKELAARAIHHLSFRRDGPFVAINCGAIPENLLEAELFGHEKGSFTDAHTQRRGRFELAAEGTLLLDEVGELSPALQVALLRFLQEGKLQRVGGRQDIAIDARVIAATNADLKAAIRGGAFREDLYFRLGVVTISLPPLRERGDDLMVLANSFLQKFAEAQHKRFGGFTNRAKIAIQQHRWPGNVRELENRIKRAVIMGDGPRVSPVDLELDSKLEKYQGKGLKEARAALEREMIERAMARHRGNITQVAADLGVSRPTLYEMMEKLEIERR